MFHLAAAKLKAPLCCLTFILDRGAALAPQLHIDFIKESDSRIWFLWFVRPALDPASPPIFAFAGCALKLNLTPLVSCHRRQFPWKTKDQSIEDIALYRTLRWVFKCNFGTVMTKFQHICRRVRQLYHMLISSLLFIHLSWCVCLPLYSSLHHLLPLSLPCKSQ